MGYLAITLIGSIILMVIGVPVAFAFGIAGLILCKLFDIGIAGAISASFDRLNMYALMALPIFILLGSLMDQGGQARRLVNFVNSFIGKKKGGLGTVLIITNTIFGAICGVATSALAALGGMLIPQMEESGYPRGYSTGMSVSASVLSLLIPPSTSMILFGVVARVSIPLLFAATVIPGLLLTLFLCLINNVMVKKIPTIVVPPSISKSERKENIIRTGKDAIYVLFMPIIILVGIYGGMFTPTEAASIAVVYVIFIGFFVYKDMTFKILWDCIIKAGSVTGSIVVVFFFFFVFSRILILEHAPDALLNFLFSISSNKYVLMLLLNVLLIFTGMIMEDTSALILAAIIYLPAAIKIGIHPLQFGAICAVNLGMGLITPPVAPILYLGGVVGGGLELKEYYLPVMYSILFAYIPVILLTTFVPKVTLILPEILMNLYR